MSSNILFCLSTTTKPEDIQSPVTDREEQQSFTSEKLEAANFLIFTHKLSKSFKYLIDIDI